MPLLDTVFLIDVMRAREKAIELLAKLEAKPEPLAIAAVTLEEFHRGIATVDIPEERRARLAEVVESRVVLPVDRKAAKRAGEIEAALWKEGESLDPEDALIAGVALANDEALVTRRTKEFSRVEGLRLVGY